jgi:tetratricopeptide (TPR) repeat protein
MRSLTFDEMKGLLPDVPELRPVLDQLLGQSRPDDNRKWAGSGALETAGDRLVDAASLRAAVEDLARTEHEHIERTFHHVAAAVERLERGDANGAAGEFLELVAIEEARDHADRAASYANAACAVTPDDPVLASLALRRRGRTRLRAGDHAAAVGDYQRAHQVALAAGDVQGSAEAAIGAGNVLEERGQWDDAEAWYRRALERLEPLGTLGAAEAWHALLNIHVVMRAKGLVEESLEPLERAEEVAFALGDDSAHVFFENARGQLCMVKQDFSAAIEHFRTAITAGGGARASVTVRLNLAEALLAAERSLEAAQEARVAEREAIVARLPNKLPEVYRLLGRVAARERDPDAFVLFERALDIVEERGLPPLERALTLQAYSTAERRVGDPATSARLEELANQIYQELGIKNHRSQWADHYGSDEGYDDDMGLQKDD